MKKIIALLLLLIPVACSAQSRLDQGGTGANLAPSAGGVVVKSAANSTKLSTVAGIGSSLITNGSIGTVDINSNADAAAVGECLKAGSTNAEIFEWTACGGGIPDPGASTDNAIVRWNGADADAVQDSAVTIGDTGDMSFPAGQDNTIGDLHCLAFDEPEALGTATVQFCSDEWVPEGVTQTVNMFPLGGPVPATGSVQYPMYIERVDANTAKMDWGVIGGDVSGSLSSLQIGSQKVGTSEIVDGGIGTVDINSDIDTPSVGECLKASATNVEVFEWGACMTSATPTVVDAAGDTSTWLMLAGSQTGTQAPLSDAGITYNASTDSLATGSCDLVSGLAVGSTASVDTSKLINATGVTPVAGGASYGIYTGVGYGSSTTTINDAIVGIHAEASKSAGTGPMTSIYGAEAIATLSTSTNADWVVGGSFSAGVEAGHASETSSLEAFTLYEAASLGEEVFGVKSTTGVGASGNVDVGVGLQSTVSSKAGGKFNTAYGIRSTMDLDGDDVTGVGLKIDDVTGATNNWAIQSDGGQSYHVGKLMLGSTSEPYSTLEILGDMYALNKVSAGLGTYAALTGDARNINTSTSSQSMTGVRGYAGIDSTYAIGNPQTGTLRGIYASASMPEPGVTLSSMYGIHADALTTAGTTTTARGSGVTVGVGTAGTIGTAYGQQITVSKTGAGVITTGVGLKIDAVTGATNNWAIQSDGGKSYHVGAIKVGSTSAPATDMELDVAGDIKTDKLHLEETDVGTDKITIIAPETMASDYTLTLPTTGGDLGQVLRTNGFGVTSWVDPTVVGDAAGDSTTWPMLAGSQTGAQAPLSDAGITYNASTDSLATGSCDLVSGLAVGSTASVDTSKLINATGSMPVAGAGAYGLYTNVDYGSSTTTINDAIIGTSSNASKSSGTGAVTAIYGLETSATLSTSTNADQVAAGVFVSDVAAGKATELDGINVWALYESATRSDEIFGAKTLTDVGGSGNVDVGVGVLAKMSSKPGGKFNTAYGFRSTLDLTGEDVTAVGLKIDNVTGATSNYAIQSDGGQSYHAGNLRVGSTSAPTVALDVTGAMKVSSTATFSGTTASRCARFDASNNLVAASADCTAGDTDTLGSDGNKGDISVGTSGTTLQINAGAVSHADMVDVAASKLIGRGSASGSGSRQEITVGSGLTMSGTTLSTNGDSLYEWVKAKDMEASGAAGYSTYPAGPSAFWTPGILFPDSGANYAYYQGFPGPSWDASSIVVQPYWTTDATGTAKTVVFTVDCRCVDALDVLDTSSNFSASPQNMQQDYGSGVTAGILMEGSAVTVTCGNVCTAGDMVQIKVKRDGSHANDDLGTWAWLLGMKVTY